MKVCFACSTGGHLNQLKELKGKIDCDEYYYVTAQNEFSKSLLKKEKVSFIIDPKRNLLKFIHNIYQSIRIFLRNKPDVIITTGSGIAFPTCIIAKIFGKKIIFIESFAKISEPSLFGKAIYPISNLTLLQWKELQQHYTKGKYVGPIFNFTNQKTKNKKKQIFLTVGSSDYRFDRLIKTIDNIAPQTEYKIIGQIGNTQYLPKNFKYKKYYTFDAINKLFEESRIVICHAGTGSISSALTFGCKVIVVPRYKKFSEAINDHQIEITKKFEKQELILGVYDTKNIFNAIENITKIKKSKNKRKPLMALEINKYIKANV